MTNISKPTARLFHAEIANESDGGIAPATVRSSIDSYLQAPEIFFPNDTERLTVADDLLRLIAYHDELDTEVRDLLP